MSWNLFKTDRRRAEPLQLKNIILATISAALKKSEGSRRLPSGTAPSTPLAVIVHVCEIELLL